MAALILPSRRIVQPQYGAALDGAFAPQWVFVPGAKGRDQASGKAVTYKGNEAYSGFGSARFVDLDAGETIYSSEAVSPGNSFILVIQYRNTAALNDCFLVSAKANWDDTYGFYVSVKGANSLEISPGGKTFPTASIAGVGVGDGAVKTLVFHFRDTSLRIYHKGRLAADITMGLGAGAWSTGLALNGYTNAGSSSGSQAISYSLVAVLRNGDPASLSINPWQLFKPVQRRVYFDMGAGGGTSPVSSDQSASYAIRGSVSSDQAASYAIRSSVNADLSASYNIQTASAVSSDLSSGYEIRTSAQSDVSAEYAIRASVQADSSASYVVRGAVLSDASASYVVRTNAIADLSAAYEIQTASGVGASLDASYNVRAAVQSDASAAYDLRTSVGAASEHAFMVRGLVSSDLDASFTVEAPITQVYADLQAAYLVDGGEVFIPSQFVASVPAGVFSARAPAGEYSATVPAGIFKASI